MSWYSLAQRIRSAPSTEDSATILKNVFRKLYRARQSRPTPTVPTKGKLIGRYAGPLVNQGQTSTQNQKILARLMRGPATNGQLAKYTLRLSARIMDLRKAGYDIESKNIGGNTWLYRLR